MFSEENKRNQAYLVEALFVNANGSPFRSKKICERSRYRKNFSKNRNDRYKADQCRTQDKNNYKNGIYK